MILLMVWHIMFPRQNDPTHGITCNVPMTEWSNYIEWSNSTEWFGSQVSPGMTCSVTTCDRMVWHTVWQCAHDIIIILGIWCVMCPWQNEWLALFGNSNINYCTFRIQLSYPFSCSLGESNIRLQYQSPPNWSWTSSIIFCIRSRIYTFWQLN